MRPLLLGLLLAAGEPAVALRIESDFTVFDEIPVGLDVRNVPGASADGYPTLILEREGAEPRTATLGKTQVSHESRSPKAAAGEVLASFSFDLRAVFPSIAAGRHRLRAEFGKGLRSETVPFGIAETTLAEAEKSAKPVEGVAFAVADGRGTVTNRRRSAVRLPAYVPPAATPLSVPFQFDRWHPARGWIPIPIGWCGTGLGEARIEPGASLEVDLAATARRGILRMRLTLRDGDERFEICSNPVLVR
jgi:hypothetical protein